MGVGPNLEAYCKQCGYLPGEGSHVFKCPKCGYDKGWGLRGRRKAGLRTFKFNGDEEDCEDCPLCSPRRCPCLPGFVEDAEPTTHTRIKALEEDLQFLNAVANASDWHDVMEDLRALSLKAAKLTGKYAPAHDPHDYRKKIIREED